jgi:hypothetical protein
MHQSRIWTNAELRQFDDADRLTQACVSDQIRHGSPAFPHGLVRELYIWLCPEQNDIEVILIA